MWLNESGNGSATVTVGSQLGSQLGYLRHLEPRYMAVGPRSSPLLGISSLVWSFNPATLPCPARSGLAQRVRRWPISPPRRAASAVMGGGRRYKHVSHRPSVSKDFRTDRGVCCRTCCSSSGAAPPTAGAYRKKHAMPIHKVRCDSDGTCAGLIRSAA